MGLYPLRSISVHPATARNNNAATEKVTAKINFFNLEFT